MRFLFCLVPALIAWFLFWVVSLILGASSTQVHDIALYLGAPIALGVFSFGWQITKPRPERGER